MCIHNKVLVGLNVAEYSALHRDKTLTLAEWLFVLPGRLGKRSLVMTAILQILLASRDK